MKAIYALLLLSLCLHLSLSYDLGPTDVVISGTFAGFDMTTICKYCQVNCYEVPVFKQDSCESKYYTYGCDIKHHCLQMSSANRFQFFTAIAMCAKFNKCKFLDVFTDQQTSQGGGDVNMDAATKGRDLMNLLLFKTANLDWRKTAKDVVTGIVSSMYSKSKSAGTTTSKYKNYKQQVDEAKADEGFKTKLQDVDATRLYEYLDQNSQRFETNANSQSMVSFGSTGLSQLAGAELRALLQLDEEAKRRKFREFVLQSVTPSLPPSVYLYFKFSQDARISVATAMQSQVTLELFPVWMKQELQLVPVTTAAAEGLQQQISKNNVRLERLMNWVNDFASTNFKKYFEAYQAMLTAGKEIHDFNVGIKTKQNCDALNSRSFKTIIEQPMKEAECKAINNKLDQEATLDSVEKEMNMEYRSLLQEFATEAGNVSIPDDALGTKAISIFFSVPQ